MRFDPVSLAGSRGGTIRLCTHTDPRFRCRYRRRSCPRFTRRRGERRRTLVGGTAHRASRWCRRCRSVHGARRGGFPPDALAWSRDGRRRSGHTGRPSTRTVQCAVPSRPPLRDRAGDRGVGAHRRSPSATSRPPCPDRRQDPGARRRARCPRGAAQPGRVRGAGSAARDRRLPDSRRCRAMAPAIGRSAPARLPRLSPVLRRAACERHARPIAPASRRTPRA